MLQLYVNAHSGKKPMPLSDFRVNYDLTPEQPTAPQADADQEHIADKINTALQANKGR